MVSITEIEGDARDRLISAIKFDPCGKPCRLFALDGDCTGFVTVWIEDNALGIGRVIGKGLVNRHLERFLLAFAKDHNCNRIISVDDPIGCRFLKRYGCKFNGRYWERLI